MKNIIALDIGGSKTLVAKFKHAPGPVSRPTDIPEICQKNQFKTIKTAAFEFYSRVADQIQEVNKNEPIDLLCIAQPGLINQAGLISPATAAHLFTSPEAENVVNPQQILTNVWASRNESRPHATYFFNDAIAQFRAILNEFPQAERTRQIGKCIIYINPGTGLGGGVALINADESIEMITDGHISQLLLPKTPATVHFDICYAGHPFSIPYQTNLFTQAESLISGLAIAQLAIAVDTFHQRNNMQPIFTPLLPKGSLLTAKAISQGIEKCLPGARTGVANAVMGQILSFVGQKYGELCLAMHQGRLSKTFQQYQWSTNQIAQIQGCTAFVDGGDLLKTPFGQQILSARQAWLNKKNHTQFIFHLPTFQGADAGVTGAACLALDLNRAKESTPR